MGVRMTAVATKLPAPELRKLRAMAVAGGMTPSGVLREMVRSATGLQTAPVAPVRVFFRGEEEIGGAGEFSTAPRAARSINHQPA